MASKTILLVDDNLDDEDLTIRSFKKHNLTNNIVVARDGAEAIEILFGAKPLKPVLILLDIKLPKIDGKEVLKRIRSDERTKLLPVVILTSSKETRDIYDSYNLGANSYIRKPVEFGEFMETVRLLGLFWLVLNEPPPV